MKILLIICAFFFILNSDKEVLLWLYFFSRFQAFYDSDDFNGQCFIGLICFDGLTIVLVYITIRAQRIFKLPENHSRKLISMCTFFLLTPLVPCLVIMKMTKCEAKML